jgi:hypothetical protein
VISCARPLDAVTMVKRTDAFRERFFADVLPVSGAVQPAKDLWELFIFCENFSENMSVNLVFVF